MVTGGGTKSVKDFVVTSQGGAEIIQRSRGPTGGSPGPSAGKGQQQQTTD